MPPTFDPIRGAQGFQHSNPPLLSLIPLIASLKIITDAGGVTALRARSLKLTGYFRDLLLASKFYSPKLGDVGFTILTPEREAERGAQLSLRILGRKGKEGGVMKRVFEGLVRRGVVGDEREPEVIRISSVPPLFFSLPLEIYRWLTLCFAFLGGRPIPLYNTFEEVRLVALYLDEALEEEHKGIETQSVEMTETS